MISTKVRKFLVPLLGITSMHPAFASDDMAIDTALETPIANEVIPATGEESQASGESKENEVNSDDSWENYSGSKSAIAKDLTGGLRVEDVVEPLTDYAYAAFGKGDPFIAPYYKHKNTNFSMEVPIVSVLQNYEIKQLKLAGIWQSLGGERKALIMDVEGKIGVEVMRGDPIGKKAGKILEVRPESVLIREYYLTRDGTREFEDVELLIPNDFSKQTGGTLVLSSDPIPEATNAPAQVEQQKTVIDGGQIQNVTKSAPAAGDGATPFLPGAEPKDETRRAGVPTVDVDKALDGTEKADINAPATLSIDKLMNP